MAHSVPAIEACGAGRRWAAAVQLVMTARLSFVSSLPLVVALENCIAFPEDLEGELGNKLKIQDLNILIFKFKNTH